MDASWGTTSNSRSDRPSRTLLLLFLIVAIAMVVGSVTLSRVTGQPEPEQHLITIPAGTAMRLSSGEDVSIIPTDLDFRLRDRLTVINEDSTAHQIGPFIIPAGQRLDTRFAEAATIEGFCSLHSTGRIRINIAGT
ncbi:MAG: hypothetical protein QGH80_07915 [Acidimicrobiales bacterium]|nr:hypothetical protein [Acidimicrobiales bacterium]